MSSNRITERKKEGNE
jgi:hypothetical protein